MKTFLRSMFLLAAMLVCSGTGRASPVVMNSPQAAGDYIGVEGGPFYLSDLSAGTSAFGVDFKFNNKWGVTVPLGYDFGNGWRAEFSAGYYEAGFGGVIGRTPYGTQTAQVNGGLNFIPLLANVSYNMKLGSRLHFYLGAGAGAVRQEGTFHDFDNPSQKSISYGQLGGPTAVLGGLDSTGWHFGFQAFAGLSLDLTAAASLNLGYRYLYVNSDLTVNGSSSGALSGQSVELGLLLKL